MELDLRRLEQFQLSNHISPPTASLGSEAIVTPGAAETDAMPSKNGYRNHFTGDHRLLACINSSFK